MRQHCVSNGEISSAGMVDPRSCRARPSPSGACWSYWKAIKKNPMRFFRAAYRRRSGKSVSASWSNGEIELVADLAYQLHLQGKHVDAATIFEGLLAIDPRNIYCLEALAALSLKIGSAEDALEYANRALAFSPKQLEALACRCEANVLLNRFAEAQQDVESLEHLGAKAHSARLTMRIANAKKFSPDLLPDATSRELDR